MAIVIPDILVDLLNHFSQHIARDHTFDVKVLHDCRGARAEFFSTSSARSSTDRHHQLRPSLPQHRQRGTSDQAAIRHPALDLKWFRRRSRYLSSHRGRSLRARSRSTTASSSLSSNRPYDRHDLHRAH